MAQYHEDQDFDSTPEHLRRWPGLYIRQGDRIVEAPAADVAVARGYHSWPDKGPIIGGRRLTIMTRAFSYQVNEEVRIIHVVEAVEEGQEVYVMGPKEAYGEYVDDRLASGSLPDWEDPLCPPFYDGAVLMAPAVDYAYDITSYRFSDPGTHEIVWRPGDLCSNTLKIEITAG